MSTELALQDAIVAAVRADERLTTLIDGRIYDRAPSTIKKPYITIGPADLVSADAECVTGDEIVQQLDVWSIEPGFAECKTICAALRKALHLIEVEQSGLRFEIEHQTTREFRDADGLTVHGVVIFRAIIDTD